MGTERLAIVRRLALARAAAGSAWALLWLVNPLLTLLAWGLLLAALDRFVADPRIEERGKWLIGGAVAGVVAVAPAFLATFAVGQTLADTTPAVDPEGAELMWALIILFALTWGVTGLVVGLGQTAGIEYQVRGAAWWGVAQAAGGCATGALMVLAWRALLGEDGLRTLGHDPRGPLAAAGMGVGGAVGGLAGGALCAVCLDWLLRRR